MISASSLNSELINKIAQDFAQATGLAVVVVNIHGEEISDLFNFTPFCQLMRQDPVNHLRCRMSDRCGGLEASKSNEPCIYRCHAGLTDFSIPLVIAGHLVGFVLCGQVRLHSDVYLIDILNVDNHWQQNPALMDEFHNVPVMDFSRVIASADLLKLIVENCLKKHLNFVVINDNMGSKEPGRIRPVHPHDSKMKKALRYIDTHLSEELRRLRDISARTTSANYLKNIRASDLMPGSISNGWPMPERCYNTAIGALPALPRIWVFPKPAISAKCSVRPTT